MFQIFVSVVVFHIVYGDPLLTGPCKMTKEEYGTIFKDVIKEMPPYSEELSQNPNFFEVAVNEYEAVDPVQYIRDKGWLEEIKESPKHHFDSITFSVTRILELYTMLYEDAAPPMPSDPNKLLKKIEQMEWAPPESLGTSIKLTQQDECVEICGNLLVGNRMMTEQFTKLEYPGDVGLYPTASVAINDWAYWHDVNLNDNEYDKGPGEVAYYLLEYGKIAATRCEEQGSGGPSELYFLIPDLMDTWKHGEIEWTEHEFWTLLLMKAFAPEALGLGHIHFIAKIEKAKEVTGNGLPPAKGVWANKQWVAKAWGAGVNCCKCEDGYIGFSFLRKCNDVCLHETDFKVLPPPKIGACNSMQSCYETCRTLLKSGNRVMKGAADSNQVAPKSNTVKILKKAEDSNNIIDSVHSDFDSPVAPKSDGVEKSEETDNLDSFDESSDSDFDNPVAPKLDAIENSKQVEDSDSMEESSDSDVDDPVAPKSDEVKKSEKTDLLDSSDESDSDGDNLVAPKKDSVKDLVQAATNDSDNQKVTASELSEDLERIDQAIPNYSKKQIDEDIPKQGTNDWKVHASRFDSSETWSKYFLVAASSSILTLILTKLCQTKRTGASVPLLNV